MSREALEEGRYFRAQPGKIKVPGTNRLTTALKNPPCKTLEEAQKLLPLMTKPRAIYFVKWGEKMKHIEGDHW